MQVQVLPPHQSVDDVAAKMDGRRAGKNMNDLTLTNVLLLTIMFIVGAIAAKLGVQPWAWLYSWMPWF